MEEGPEEQRMHEVYLPFTAEELLKHFAPITGSQADPERHLDYYRQSLERWGAYAGPAGIPKGDRRNALSAALQIEEDERFWVIAAPILTWVEYADANGWSPTAWPLLDHVLASELPPTGIAEDAA